MKTKVKRLILLNFKGIRNLEIEFDDRQTDILGDNGTGKTSIFDSFTWLLFGKDSEDRKDFDIKTLDGNNQVIEKIEHSVTGYLDIDGRELKLCRTLREKWVKSKGDEQATFQGNETIYMIDDIPCTMAEYQKRISEITPEQQFKLLTSPWFFNSLPWKDMRSMLTGIASIPTDSDILSRITDNKNKDIIDEITRTLSNGASIDKLKQKYSFEKGKLRDELKLIPARIDEVNNMKPEKLDYNNLKKIKEDIEKEIVSIEAKISDTSVSVEEDTKKRTDLLLRKSELARRIREIMDQVLVEREKLVKERNEKPESLRDKIRRGEQRILDLSNDLSGARFQLKKISDEIDELVNKNISLGNEFDEANKSTFTWNPERTTCEYCGQPLPESNLEALRDVARNAFNNSKREKMNSINSRGVSNRNRIDELTKSKESIEETVRGFENSIESGKQFVEETKSELETLERDLFASEIDSVETLLERNPEYKVIVKEFNEIEIPEIKLPDTTVLSNERQYLLNNLEIVKKDLETERTIEDCDRRIEQLGDIERKYAQQIADLERIEYQVDQFQKLKSTMIENSVNGLFPDHLRFKLFRTLINGSEEECCETLINGVPFSGASNAERIKAGISIINVFSEHFDRYCPIFVDNAEAANVLPNTNSQLIRLVVTEDKKLIVRV